MDQLLFIVISILIFLGAIGCGASILRILNAQISLGLAFGIGLASYYFLSACLSLFSLFTATFGFAFFLLGNLLFSYNFQRVKGLFSLSLLVNFFLLSLVYLYLAMGVMPNPDDDYQKYFLHSFHLLNTGSLFYNPFGVGYETLGGFAFVQALFLSVLPVDVLFYCDYYLGIFAILTMQGELLSPKKKIYSIPLFLLLILIPAQVVNSTPVYLGVALMLTSYNLFVSPNGLPARSTHFFMLGILTFLLLLSKISYLYFPVSLVLVLLAMSPKLATFKLACLATLTSTFLTLPWFPTLITNFFYPVNSFPALGQVPRDTLLGFSTTPFFWGGSPILYLSLLFLIALFAFHVWSHDRRLLIFLPLLSLLLSVVALLYTPLVDYVWGPAALRYLIPCIIATLFFYIILCINSSKSLYAMVPILLTFLVLYLWDLPRTLDMMINGKTLISFNHAQFAQRKGFQEAIFNQDYCKNLSLTIDKIPEGTYSKKIIIFVANPYSLLLEKSNSHLIHPFEYSSYQSPSYSLDGYSYLLLDHFTYTNIVSDAQRSFDGLYNQERKNSIGASRLLNVLLMSELISNHGQFLLFKLPSS